MVASRKDFEFPLVTYKSIFSLKESFFSFLKLRIATIISLVNENFSIISSSIFLTFGHDDIVREFSIFLLDIKCQSSSDKNGIKGCNNLRLFSKNNKILLCDFLSIADP